MEPNAVEDLKEAPSYKNRFHFPYRTTLNFNLLIRALEERADQPNNPQKPLLYEILKQVKAIPELNQPIEDLSMLREFKDEIELLMSVVVPLGMSETIATGIIIPFQPVTIYGTKKFNELFACNDEGQWDIGKLDGKKAINELIAYAGCAILEKYYGKPIEHPDVMKNRALDAVTGNMNSYKPDIMTAYVEVRALKTPKPLSEIDLTPLNQNFFDADFWLTNFPPDTFEFSGFTVYRMIDITDREMISDLEYSMLHNETIFSIDGLKEIEQKLQHFFKVPDLRLGLAPIMKNSGRMGLCGSEFRKSIIPEEKTNLIFENFEQSIYAKAFHLGGPYLVDDLTMIERSPVEEELLNQGIRSIIPSPIFKNGELIGVMEIASSQAGAFNFITMLKLKEILPLISVVLQRNAREFENRIQSTIREQFTSIHPAVEWRFIKSAMEMLRQEQQGNPGEIEPIIFNDVIPVYGQIDLRGSSERRNEAIRLDMLDRLSAAKEILTEAHKEFPLTLLDEMIYRIEKFSDKLSKSIESSDEGGIMEFLKNELEPALKMLVEKNVSIKKPIEEFLAILNPEHELNSVRRKEFEDSLTMINDLVAQILDTEEERTQKLIPHYFEKYKTDGVDYNLYIGQSLLEEGSFDPLFIKSARLWQLVNMVKIARETHRLLPSLPTPLETTQLILCYSNPFSIMFRMDEKRFDVAGAYNIRYEIVKKRIDKAHVKGSDERITQPHKIAIVYSQEKEVREYERYFEYMRAKGLVSGDTEYLEVEPLQGLTGLKALRIQVNYDLEEPKLNYDEEELFRHIKGELV